MAKITRRTLSAKVAPATAQPAPNTRTVKASAVVSEPLSGYMVYLPDIPARKGGPAYIEFNSLAVRANPNYPTVAVPFVSVGSTALFRTRADADRCIANLEAMRAKGAFVGRAYVTADFDGLPGDPAEPATPATPPGVIADRYAVFLPRTTIGGSYARSNISLLDDSPPLPKTPVGNAATFIDVGDAAAFAARYAAYGQVVYVTADLTGTPGRHPAPV